MKVIDDVVAFDQKSAALKWWNTEIWEVRNLMTCDWLIHLARTLEQDQLGLANGQFHNRPAPHIFGHQVGKRQAEHLLYWTTIAAWLLLPVIAAATQ